MVDGPFMLRSSSSSGPVFGAFHWFLSFLRLVCCVVPDGPTGLTVFYFLPGLSARFGLFLAYLPVRPMWMAFSHPIGLFKFYLAPL